MVDYIVNQFPLPTKENLLGWLVCLQQHCCDNAAFSNTSLENGLKVHRFWASPGDDI